MPPEDLPILFPLGGLDESLAKDAQPPMTTREFVNVRTTDPTTGEKRGAKRFGTRKLVATQIGTGPVRDLASVTYDARATTYEAVDSLNESGDDPLEVVWKKAIPAGVESQRVAVDRYSNVYCLNGPAGICKFNSAGVLLSTVEVPVQHPDQRLLSLVVDDAFGVYTGVQYGPQGTQGQVFKFRDNADGNLELAWILDVEGFVPDLTVVRGFMYVLENRAAQATASGVPDPTLGTAHVTVYDSLDAAQPRALWTRAVPYPATQLAVNTSGSVYVTCAPNSRRSETYSSIYSTCSIEWTPELLVNYQDRIWAWLDASDLEDMADGDEVKFWRDKSGWGRNLFHWGSGTDVFRNIDPPVYKMNGLCDKPTVLFAGRNGLATQDTSTTDAENKRSSNLALLPTVNNERFIVFMVIAPRKGGTERGCVLEQWGEVKYRLITNEGDTIDGTPTPGALRLAISPASDAGGSSTSEVDPGSFVNDLATLRNDVAIVAFRMGGDDASEGSYWRINGTTVDTFTVNRDQVRYHTCVGFSQFPAGIGTSNPQPDNYEGEVAEIITVIDNGATPGVDEISAGEIEQIEGYLAHKYGIQHLLDPHHTYASSPPPLPSGGSSIDPPPDPGGTYGEVLKSPYGIALKLGSNNGGVKWAFAGAGVGYAIAIDPPTATDPDGVYCMGPEILAPDPNEDDTTVRKLLDQGTAPGLSWTLDSSFYPQIDYFVRMVVDNEKNLYIGHHTLIPTHSMYKINHEGAIEWIWDSDDSINGSLLRVIYDIALDPSIPDYGTDTIKEPEFAYLVGYHWGEETLFKVRLVQSTPNDASPRVTVHLAVANGNIRKVIPNAESPDVEVATVTGGSAALDADSPWLQSAVLFGEVFYIDGASMLVYNPRTNAVTPYAPTSPGEMPRRPRLIGQWRSRLVTARFSDEPHNWFMCAVDDPYNVDLAPPGDFDPGQAVIGNDSRAGVCPDIINAFIPATDDYALFGGDHSIHRMSGDPMAGGVFELVSSKIGMAYGRPWAQDERGTIYFAGSTGGIWVTSPAGDPPKEISDPKVYDRLRAVDFGEYTFRLAWNADGGGLDVFFVPLSATPSAAIEHYFWERDTETWSVTKFAAVGHQPTSVLEVDGDAVDDRRVLIGCGDGYLRTWDPEALTDDTQPIAASVLIGPIMQTGRRDRLRYSRLQVVLATEQAGCRYELAATDSAQLPPEVGEGDGGLLMPGVNNLGIRAAGRAGWLRLLDASTIGRWAFESATVSVVNAGRART